MEIPNSLPTLDGDPERKMPLVIFVLFVVKPSDFIHLRQSGDGSNAKTYVALSDIRIIPLPKWT
jgi:hypothetical protein